MNEKHRCRNCDAPATGKPELFVRDHFGAIIADKNPDLIVSRVWNKHDLEKMKKGVRYQNYVSLLMTSIGMPVPNSLAGVTKYSASINKALKKYGSDLMEKSVVEARDPAEIEAELRRTHARIAATGGL